jgi:hypothetical protein
MKLKIRRDALQELIKKIGSSNLFGNEDWVSFEIPQSSIRIEEIENQPVQEYRCAPDNSLMSMKLPNGEEFILTIKEDKDDSLINIIQLVHKKESEDITCFKGKLKASLKK